MQRDKRPAAASSFGEAELQMMHGGGETVAKHWRRVSQVYMCICMFMCFMCLDDVHIVIPTGEVPEVHVSAVCLLGNKIQAVTSNSGSSCWSFERSRFKMLQPHVTLLQIKREI